MPGFYMISDSQMNLLLNAWHFQKISSNQKILLFNSQKGTPIKIANAIETFHFDDLPGKLFPYASYDSLMNNLK